MGKDVEMPKILTSKHPIEIINTSQLFSAPQHINSIFNLLIQIGLVTCQNGVPTFEWVQDKFSPSGVPLLSINFHDGQPNDVAILRQFNPIAKSLNEKEEDIDNCIFDGFFENEEKVYVTLTGGCPFEESFDVSKDS